MNRNRKKEKQYTKDMVIYEERMCLDEVSNKPTTYRPSALAPPTKIDSTNQTDSIPGTWHLVKHIRSADGTIFKRWECGVCNRDFLHQYTLLRHLPTHTNVRSFVCKECGKAFRQLSTLSQHRTIHSKDRPHKCNECNKSFNRVSTLISHRKTHSDEKPFRCSVCSKGFHQKGNLRNHEYIHKNVRPYRCPFCSKGFNQLSNLVCHKHKAHPGEQSSMWPCCRCGAQFTKRSQLRAHELEFHQVALESSRNDQKSISNCINLVLGPPPELAVNGIVANQYDDPVFALLYGHDSGPWIMRAFECPNDRNKSILRRVPINGNYGDPLKISATVYERCTVTGESEFNVEHQTVYLKMSSMANNDRNSVTAVRSDEFSPKICIDYDGDMHLLDSASQTPEPARLPTPPPMPMPLPIKREQDCLLSQMGPRAIAVVLKGEEWLPFLPPENVNSSLSIDCDVVSMCMDSSNYSLLTPKIEEFNSSFNIEHECLPLLDSNASNEHKFFPDSIANFISAIKSEGDGNIDSLCDFLLGSGCN